MANDLRPKKIEDFFGQENIKKNISMIIESSIIRKSPLPHIILYGHSGYGKTTLANIIANTIQKEIITVMAPSVKYPSDIISALIKLKKGDILFIDEIHRLNVNVEEVLYSAMEDSVINIISGNKEAAIKIEIEPFTLIGATTKLGSLSKPFKDRFPVGLHFSLYSEAEMIQIIDYNIQKLDFKILDEEVKKVILNFAKKTPRVINNIILRIRDYCVVYNIGSFDIKHMKDLSEILKIDFNGLSEIDNKYLSLLKKSNRPMGVKSIALMLEETEETIENDIEPWLLAMDLIEKTHSGRIIKNGNIISD